MSSFARRRMLIPRETIGCVIQRRRTRTWQLQTAQRVRAVLVFRRTRAAAALRPGSISRLSNHLLTRYELSVHLHFAGTAGATPTSRQLPAAMMVMRSPAAPLAGARRATPGLISGRNVVAVQPRTGPVLVPRAPAQQISQAARVSIAAPALRHRLLREQRAELQISRSFTERSEQLTSRSRIERIHRLGVMRLGAGAQLPVETAVQPRALRQGCLPSSPANEPPQTSPRYWLRRQWTWTAETTPARATAIERRWPRSQDRTVAEQRTPPAASMTWRKSASTSAGAVSAPPASLPSPTPATRSMLTTVHHQPPQLQAPREAAPAVLSRATIDRLAEDVMQRLERRVRIERERRGL